MHKCFARGTLSKVHPATNPETLSSDSGEVPRGEKMLYSGTDPESYITDHTLVYEDQTQFALL